LDHNVAIDKEIVMNRKKRFIKPRGQTTLKELSKIAPNLKRKPSPKTMDTKHLLHNGEYHTLLMFLEVYSSFNMFLAHPHVATVAYQ
jgi:hypothetical protein